MLCHFPCIVMPPVIQPSCALGQFYSKAASGCRDCVTVCGLEYGGGPNTAECRKRCPGYENTTLTSPPTAVSTPSPSLESDVFPWIILASVLVLVLVVVGIICFKNWPKIKCCFRTSKTVAEETAEGKSMLVVSAPCTS